MQLIDVGRSEGSQFAYSADEYPEDVYQTPVGRTMGEFSRQIAQVRRDHHDLKHELFRTMDWHTRALDLVTRCSTIAREMEEWRDWGAIRYRPWHAAGLHPIDLTPSVIAPSTSGIFLPSLIYLFPTLSTAGMWAVFWCTRLKLIETMIDLSTLLRNAKFMLGPELDEYALHTTLLACVDDILACVPYLLGELDESGALNLGSHGKSIGAYYLLWPLHVAGTVTQALLQQVGRFWWIMDRLTQIGDMFGVKQAHVLRDYRLAHPGDRPL